MKKIVVLLILLSGLSVLNAQEPGNDSKIFLYIPEEQEIEYYMNFYARLNALDLGEKDIDEIKKCYDLFLKQDDYRNTYQSLLLESYLLNTDNRKVKKIISDYIEDKKYTDNFSQALIRLYSSKEEKMNSKAGTQIRHNYRNQFYDENINLFTMNEQYAFDDKLGFMFFKNDYNIFQIDLSPDNPQQDNTQSFYAIYGGGSNSLLISFTSKTAVGEEEFDTSFLYKDFYEKKFENYQVNELPLTGILKRSGASKVYIGIGDGSDEFPGVENFSSVIYLYSKEEKTAYRIDFFMNMTENNNNYSFRYRIYNHLVFQSLLTFINE